MQGTTTRRTLRTKTRKETQRTCTEERNYQFSYETWIMTKKDRLLIQVCEMGFLSVMAVKRTDRMRYSVIIESEGTPISLTQLKKSFVMHWKRMWRDWAIMGFRSYKPIRKKSVERPRKRWDDTPEQVTRSNPCERRKIRRRRFFRCYISRLLQSVWFVTELLLLFEKCCLFSRC